ncbi:hypothetical protein ACHAXT_002846 [Thalassiosira profunda]
MDHFIGLGAISIHIDILLEKSSVAAAERKTLFSKDVPELEVARYNISLKTSETEGAFNAPSNAQSRTESEGSLRYVLSNGVVRDCQFVDITTPALFAGEITVQSVRFTFDDLLGVYIRKRLSQAKKAFHASSSVKKPSDKAYIKALAKAARQAPGSADSFRHLEGWHDVYKTA